MLLQIIKIIKQILGLFRKTEQQLISEVILLRKENEILLRQNKSKIIFQKEDRQFLATLNCLNNILPSITICTPKTILEWQKRYIAKIWTYQNKRSGRPPIKTEIKDLVLQMKNANLSWGAKRIQGELLKLNIKLDTKTIRKIITTLHKTGKLRSNLTWRKFLTLQAHSLYAMDFFIVDTILKQRFYIHFIIHHQTRQIIQYAITTNPIREFIRQQMIELQERTPSLIKLIRDNASVFNLPYHEYTIQEIRTSPYAPNMNAIAERFVRSIRQEALDNYIIINERQLKNIIDRYIDYYNRLRPHQGLEQRIPKGYSPPKGEKIVACPILDGLHHHYERRAA